MPNYDYANGAGLTALAKRTFEKIKSKITTDVVTSEAANPIAVETDAAQYAKNTHLTLAPIQDLHGYDHPWPAGGGKNLLPMTVDGIKTNSQNANISWNGNVGTVDGVTITLHTDDGISVSKISVSGTPTNTVYFCVGTFNLKSGVSYVLNGCPSNKPDNGVLYVSGQPSGFGSWVDGGSGATYNAAQDWNEIFFYIRIWANVAQNNDWYPMIRLASVSDATFEPYSNICPITPMGHRNLLQVTAQSQTVNGVTFTVNDDGTITANGTASGNADFIFNTTTILSDGKYYWGGTPSGGGLSTYYVRYTRGFNGTDSGNGAIQTYQSGAQLFGFVRVVDGVTVKNVLFKPIICPASDPDSTFVPYGMARVGAKVTGFNIWDEEWEVGALNSDGSVDSSSNRRTTSFIPVIPNTTYYQKSPTTAYIGRYAFYNADKQIVKYDGNGVPSETKEVTSPENAHYLRITFGVNYGTTYNNDICINISDEEKNGTYEPYTESVSSLDLPEPVYSGTLDLETGEVVVDMGIVDLGTLTWTYKSNYLTFETALPNSKTGVYREVANILCEQYASMSHASLDASSYGCAKGSGTATLIVKDASYTDAATFKTAMSGVQLCYELATPVTYHLAPQQLALFKGANNISTNTKTVQVTYREGSLATLEELNAISFDLSNVKSKLPPIIIKDGMLQVTYDDGQ